jgi:hypothetical protein
MVTCTADGSHVLTLETTDPLERGGFRATLLTLDGDTTWSRHYPVAGSVLTARRRSELLDSAAAVTAHGTADPPAVVRREIQKLIPMPDQLPAASRLMAGEDGTIWVEHQRAAPDSVDWLILDRHGNMIGRVAAPARLRLLTASAKGVWATVTGRLDVPVLVELRVDRAPRTAPRK